MNETWVKVYTTNNALVAEILKQGLIESDIPAVVINKQLAAYNFGEVHVMVRSDHFDKAMEYIIQNEIE